MGYTYQEIMDIESGKTTREELDLLKGNQDPVPTPEPVPARKSDAAPMFDELSAQEQAASRELGPVPPVEGASFTEQLATRKQSEAAKFYREQPAKRLNIVTEAYRKGEPLGRFVDTSMYDGMNFDEAKKLYDFLSQAAGKDGTINGEVIPTPDKDLLGGLISSDKGYQSQATVGLDQIVVAGIKEGTRELGRTAAAGIDAGAEFLGGEAPGALEQFDSVFGKQALDTSESMVDTFFQETAQIAPGVLAGLGIKFKPGIPVAAGESFLGKAVATGGNVARTAANVAKTEGFIAASASPEMKIGFADGLTNYLFSGEADEEAVKKIFTSEDGKVIPQDLLKDKFSILMEGMVLSGLFAGALKGTGKAWGFGKDALVFPIQAVFSKEAMKKDIARSAISDLAAVLDKGKADPDAGMKAGKLILQILESQDSNKTLTVPTDNLGADIGDLKITIKSDYLDTLYEGFKDEISKIKDTASLDNDRALLPSEQARVDDLTLAMNTAAGRKKGLEQQQGGGLALDQNAQLNRERIGAFPDAAVATAEATGGMNNLGSIAKGALNELTGRAPKLEAELKTQVADITDDLFEGWDKDTVVSALTKSIQENKGGHLTNLNQQKAREYATQIYDTYVKDRTKKNDEYNSFLKLVEDEELSPELQQTLQENGDLLKFSKDKETGEYNLPSNFGEAYKLIQKLTRNPDNRFALQDVKTAITRDEITRLARDDVMGPGDVSLKQIWDGIQENYKAYRSRWYNESNAADIGASRVSKMAQGLPGTMGESERQLGGNTQIAITEGVRGDVKNAVKGGATDALQWQVDNIKTVGSLEEAEVATQRIADLTLGEALKSIEPTLMKLGRDKNANAGEILATLDDTLAQMETDMGDLFEGRVTEKINNFRKSLQEKGGRIEDLVQEIDALKSDIYVSQTAVYSDVLKKVLRDTPFGPEISSTNPEQTFGKLLMDPKGADNAQNLLDAIAASGADEGSQALAKRGLQETYLRNITKSMLEPDGTLSIAKAEKYLQGDNGVGSVLFNDQDSAERLAALNTILDVAINPKVFRQSGDIKAHAPKNPRAIQVKGVAAMGSVITLAVGILSRLGASLRIGAKAAATAANSTEIATALMDQFYTDPDFAKQLIQAELDYQNKRPNEFVSRMVYTALAKNTSAYFSGKNQSQPLTIEEVDQETLKEWEDIQKSKPQHTIDTEAEQLDFKMSPKREDKSPFR